MYASSGGAGKGKSAAQKIPKLNKNRPWNDLELEGFKRLWPHMRNVGDSILRHATLTELIRMEKSRRSKKKSLTKQMAANFEMLQTGPVQVEAGPDDCLDQVHKARFLRGFVGDSQKIWIQARQALGADGLDPIANYETHSLGVGDLLSPRVWAEIHKPNSMLLSSRMLSRKSVEDAWRFPDRVAAPKEFENLEELRWAVATLECAIHKAMPWNMAFKTLSLFLLYNDFGAAELEGTAARVSLLANFVDEILRANARNWEEKKEYLSHQDLCGRWFAFLSRNQLHL